MCERERGTTIFISHLLSRSGGAYHAAWKCYTHERERENCELSKRWLGAFMRLYKLVFLDRDIHYTLSDSYKHRPPTFLSPHVCDNCTITRLSFFVCRCYNSPPYTRISASSYYMYTQSLHHSAFIPLYYRLLRSKRCRASHLVIDGHFLWACIMSKARFFFFLYIYTQLLLCELSIYVDNFACAFVDCADTIDCVTVNTLAWRVLRADNHLIALRIFKKKTVIKIQTINTCNARVKTRHTTTILQTICWPRVCGSYIYGDTPGICVVRTPSYYVLYRYRMYRVASLYLTWTASVCVAFFFLPAVSCTL